MMAREQGELVDAAALASEIQRAVEAVVTMQVQCGMDYVSEGEMSKISFMEYPYRRISGFDGPLSGWIPPDIADFQEAQDFWYDASAPHVALRQNNGPVQLLDPEAVQQDIAHLRSALSAIGGQVEGFLCAASPGSVANPGTTFYHDEALFLGAITDAIPTVASGRS